MRLVPMLRGMDDHDHTHLTPGPVPKPALMDPRRGPFRSQRVFNNILQGILGATDDVYRAFYAYCQLGQIGDFVR